MTHFTSRSSPLLEKDKRLRDLSRAKSTSTLPWKQLGKGLPEMGPEASVPRPSGNLSKHSALPKSEATRTTESVSEARAGANNQHIVKTTPPKGGVS